MDIETFIKGDESTLKELIDEMQKPLLKYSYSILLNYADAEDAVQTAFVKTYTNRKNIKDSKKLSAYLYRVTFNESINIIRRRRFFVMERTGLSYKDSNYISEEMTAALGKLKAQDRALVYSRAVDEMSYIELAEIHGKSEQTLRKRYERAKVKLADILKPYEKE